MLNSKLDLAEERVSRLAVRFKEVFQTGETRKVKILNIKEKLKDGMQRPHMSNGIPEGQNGE